VTFCRDRTVLGVMYVAFLIARLANLYGTRGHRRD
jgi:hypothetical protein